MLEQILTDQATVERLRSDPLWPHIQSFIATLESYGYATFTISFKIKFLVDFYQWLLHNKITMSEIDERIVDTYREEPRKQDGIRPGQISTIREFVDHLRSANVIPSREPDVRETQLSLLEEQYRRYLQAERGLTMSTVTSYLPFVHRFLIERFGSEVLRLRELKPSDISNFILRYAQTMSPGSAKVMVTALRSFFRFLLQCGEIDIDLAGCVPAVVNWRLSNVPKYLTSQELQALLDACNQDTSIGRRDYAILLLLARLGLRGGEVVALSLDDINWRAGEVTVQGKGLFHDRMPIPTDVGQALATYLRDDRPMCDSRRVFIRMRAPRRGFAHPSTVSTIVMHALDRAGLDPAIKGAHLLRHTLATGMLRKGGSLSEIGEVLRHRVTSTTEIYAKVDQDGLRSLAHPWPVNGDRR
jgi:site-specific recombinase XerD